MHIREETRTLPQRKTLLLLVLVLNSLVLLASPKVTAIALVRLAVVSPKLLLLRLVPAATLEPRKFALVPRTVLLLPSSCHKPSSSVVPLARRCVRGLNASACTLPECVQRLKSSPAAVHNIICLSTPPEDPSGKSDKRKKRFAAAKLA